MQHRNPYIARRNPYPPDGPGSLGGRRAGERSRGRTTKAASAGGADTRNGGNVFNRSLLARLCVVATGSLVLATLMTTPSGAKAPAKSFFGGWGNTTATETSVQATIVLPSYTCKKGDNLGPGIGAYDNQNSAWNQEFIYMACAKVGKSWEPSYGSTGIEVDGAYTYPSLAMSAGDSIEFTTTCGPSGTVSTIENLNTTQSVSNSSSSPSSCTDGGAGDLGIQGRGVGGQSNLPAFGSIDYSNVTINALPIGSFSPTTTNYYEGKKNQIDTGALTDGGTAFVTTQVEG